MSELWHESTWDSDSHRYHLAITREPIKPPKPLPVFGVQVHALWTNMMYGSGAVPSPALRQHLTTLREHGVQLIRVDYGWSAGQPTNAALSATRWYNARLRAVLDMAGELGMQVLVTIHQSPGWTRPGTVATDAKRYPADLMSWKKFCSEFDRMFGPHPAVFGWEIWNEPNLEGFTAISDPVQRAVKYAQILDAAVLAMVRPVMFGGPSQCDDQFVKDVLNRTTTTAPPLWSVHPYMVDQTIPPDDPSLSWSKGRVAHYPTVRDAFLGRADRPIWWSEFGFSVHSNAGVPPETPWKKGVPDEATAADHLIRQMRLAVEWGIAGVVVYCAARTVGDVHVQGFSLIRPDGTPTRQLVALGEFFASGQARSVA